MPSRPDNPSLLATLVRHYEDLVDHVRHRFSSRGFARDVVHDLCVQLLERPARTTAVHPLAFLQRASVYRAIDRQRAESTHANLVVSMEEVPDLRSHEADGAQHVHLCQQIEALRLAIDGLPPRCRQVFLLHRLHDMTQEDIAQAFGISRNMVARHVARAMQDLRPLLDGGTHAGTPAPAYNARAFMATPSAQGEAS